MTSCRTLLIAGLVSLLPSVGFGQALREVASAEIGLSTIGVRRLDSLMAAYTSPGRQPALMVMVARHGRIGYWKAAGVRDLATGEPLNRTDYFRLFSITKPVTAVAVLQLWEQGKLSLDDPVSRFLPAMAKVGVYAGTGKSRPPVRPLTIRHLLTFATGMTYGTFGFSTPVDSLLAKARIFNVTTSSADLVERLAALPLLGDPGDSVAYGFQTDLLGVVVEAVSGMSLDRYFQERIFAPLGIRESGFFMSPSQLGRYPIMYTLSPGRSPRVYDARDTTSDWVKPFGRRTWINWYAGGAGLVSTASDYIRFVQMLANRGELDGVRLLRPATVDTMTRAHIPGTSERSRALFGLGWAHAFSMITAVDINAAGGGGHNGLYSMNGASNTFWWVDPVSGVAAMVWGQSLPQDFNLFHDFRRAVAAAVIPER